MSNTIQAALEQAEPIDPEHYFAKISFASQHGPEYGLLEAQLPPESAPLELDEVRVMVAERVDDDEFGTRPVLTVMLNEADGIEEAVDAGEDLEEVELAPDEAHVELLVAQDDEASGGIPNSVLQNPLDVKAIIKRVMRTRRLDRVYASPEDVHGLPARYSNAARFLVEAGFRRVEDDDSADRFELVGEPILRKPTIIPEVETSETQEAELAQAA